MNNTHVNHPMGLPSSFLLWYSSTLLGYLQDHMATSPIKAAEHIIPKFDIGVKLRKKRDEDMTINMAYLRRNGNTFFSIQLVRKGPKCLWLYR